MYFSITSENVVHNSLQTHAPLFGLIHIFGHLPQYYHIHSDAPGSKEAQVSSFSTQR